MGRMNTVMNNRISYKQVILPDWATVNLHIGVTSLVAVGKRVSLFLLSESSFVGINKQFSPVLSTFSKPGSDLTFSLSW